MPKSVSSGAWGAVKPRGRYNIGPAEDRTFKGVRFGSKAEMARGAELMLLRDAGKIMDLRFQPKFDVAMHGVHLCTYTADSMYFDAALGTIVIEEVKSEITRKDQYYRLRRRAAEIYHNMIVTELVR